MQENADQNNSEYGHFVCSPSHNKQYKEAFDHDVVCIILNLEFLSVLPPMKIPNCNGYSENRLGQRFRQRYRYQGNVAAFLSNSSFCKNVSTIFSKLF